MMSIEEALEAVKNCLRAGVSTRVIVFSLLEDGFNSDKIKIILRWAQMESRIQ